MLAQHDAAGVSRGGCWVTAPPAAPPGPSSPCSTPAPAGGDPRIAAGTRWPGHGTWRSCPGTTRDTPRSLTAPPTAHITPIPLCPPSPGGCRGPPPTPYCHRVWEALQRCEDAGEELGSQVCVPPPGWGSPAAGWLPGEEPLVPAARGRAGAASLASISLSLNTATHHLGPPHGSFAARPPQERGREPGGGWWVVGAGPPAPTEAAVGSGGARVPPPVTAGIWGARARPCPGVSPARPCLSFPSPAASRRLLEP